MSGRWEPRTDSQKCKNYSMMTSSCVGLLYFIRTKLILFSNVNTEKLLHCIEKIEFVFPIDLYLKSRRLWEEKEDTNRSEERIPFSLYLGYSSRLRKNMFAVVALASENWFVLNWNVSQGINHEMSKIWNSKKSFIFCFNYHTTNSNFQCRILGTFA